MTSFTQLQFIFRFFPVFFLIYYMVPWRMRSLVMIAGSLVFYATGDVRFVLLLILMSLVNWALSSDEGKHQRFWAVSAIVLDIGILATFKYLSHRFGQGMMPVGISFYTFRMVSYQADLLKAKFEKPSLTDSLAYFCMFPQLVSGPIARYSDLSGMNDQWEAEEKKAFSERAALALTRLEQGLVWFIPGFAMKVLLADHLAILWNDIGTIGYESISTPLAWLGTVTYSLELYFDFWGYSLMAAGIGVMLGYPFIKNFDHPYAAGSVSEFYRRWHVTLGTWFRDYVYIPLGGSRKGFVRTTVNLFAVWLLTALWHGVTLNFLIWGMLLFIMIFWEKNIWSKNEKLKKVFGRINVLVLIPVSWAVFAIPVTGDMMNFLSRLFGIGQAVSGNPMDFARLLSNYWPYLSMGLILLIPGISSWYMHNRKRFFIKLALIALFWVTAYSVSARTGNPFMYLQF